MSRQASLAGECWPAPILCAGISPLCPLHPCCCALLCGSEASPLCHTSLPVKGLPTVWKLFPLHSSLPEVQVLSLFFCLFFFLSFALPRYVGSFLPLGRSEVFCQCSVVVPHVDVLVGSKVISTSHSSAILELSPDDSHSDRCKVISHCGFVSFFFFFFFFWLRFAPHGILVLRPGIEPGPPAVKAWSANHWTTRESPHLWF